MNVNNKNMKVAFPKLLLKTLENPKESTNPRANIHNKLGQSIPMVNQSIKQPININKTCIASVESPPKEGMNLPMKQSTTQIRIIIKRYNLLSFKAIIIISFLRCRLLKVLNLF